MKAGIIMYTAHVFTEVEEENPVTENTIDEVLSGYDLTGCKMEALELAGGDILIVEKEPDEEPERYHFNAVSKTANYAKIGARIMDAFGDGMTDRAYVFTAAQIALVLRANNMYIFPECNPFIDLLVGVIHISRSSLTMNDIAQWISQCACRGQYPLYQGTIPSGAWSDGIPTTTLYDFYIEKFGQCGERGIKWLVDEIASYLQSALEQ